GGGSPMPVLRSVRSLLFPLASLALVACSPSQEPAAQQAAAPAAPAAAPAAPAATEQGPVIYRGARLIRGDGSPVIEDSVFIVEDGRFTAVGVRGGVAMPSGVRQVDLAGLTVMPAMIDGHVHL